MLKNNECIPHYLFSSRIQVNPHKSNGGFFTFETEVMTRGLVELQNILASLHTEHDEVYCWFTMDRLFNRRQALAIETHLERVIEEELQHTWKVNVLLIPADLNNSLSDYLHQLDLLFFPLSKKYPDEPFAHLYNAEGGGLLDQAFLIEAVRHFGGRYTAIHHDKDEDQPISIQHDVQIDPHSWLSMFKTFLHDYDYSAALELLGDLSSESQQLKAMEGLLNIQIKRMNFAFDEAYQHLTEVLHILPSNPTLQTTADILLKLTNTDSQQQELERIVELFRQIDVYLDTDDISSFLVRFYRAREAVLYYLLNYARTANLGGKITQVKKSSIYQVFEEMEELYDRREMDGHYGAYFFLKSQNTYNILQFRNKSFIGHSRNSIQPRDLWLSFAGTTSTTISKAKRRFQLDADLLLRDLGVEADDNYYSIHILLLQLADGLEKERVTIQDEAAANV